ncbi:MAG: glycoside hydrolase family 43 protein [Christensenellaceae bacterium]
MNMKKTWAIGLASVLAMTTVLALAGCGEPEASYEYPEKPDWNRKWFLQYNSGNPSAWDLELAHDPVMVEDEGTYYVFGTDNFGEFGYQIRKSTDLLNWTYVGVAIPNFGNSGTVLQKGEAGESPLQEVYDLLSQSSKFNCATLWAPEVYPAADGGWWLYGCWTTTFGSMRSVIFQCYAEEVTGPYEYVDTIIFSDTELPGAGLGRPNAIDASVFTDAEGRLWMSYGSWSGFGMIELDPETGLRKDGYTYDMIVNGEIDAQQYTGGVYLTASATEGSVISYHENVPVYTGDISKEEYDESKWTTQSSYYLVGSNGSLSENYNMHCWKSSQPNTGYTSLNGKEGNQISGSFSWRTSKDDSSINFDFFCPGHSDMYTLSDGTNLMIYHDRIVANNAGNHYLMLSMYDFNSKGDLVLSPNRYANEKIRTIDPAEITALTKGKYDVVEIPYTATGDYKSAKAVWATEGVVFNKNGTISGAMEGTWKMYGDHYIYLEIYGTKYYGSVMPAWIEKNGGNGGLTISALSDKGEAIYFNMHFDKK